MKYIPVLLASAVALGGTGLSHAYDAGEIIVKAGVAHVAPKSDNLSLPGAEVEVKGDTQLGLTLTYMATPLIGVELLAATPFKHKIEVNGDTAGTVKHLPPTVSGQYYPLGDTDNKFQPYVGLGVNATFFFDEEGVADALGPMNNSYGLALSAGLNYNIDDRFVANVAVWQIDIDSELDEIGEDVEIDPLVFMVGGGYRF